MGVTQSSPPLTVMVRNARGAIQYDVSPPYVSREETVAAVSASGTIRGVAAGSRYVVATLSNRPDVRDSVRVRVPPIPGPLVPSGLVVAGQSYFGRDNYIEYIAGNSPVVFTAPQGGMIRPSDFATRTCGITGADLNTQELVRAMQTQYFRRTGKYPHVVINRLHRSKMDANRDLSEATWGGDPRAGIVWTEWHAGRLQHRSLHLPRWRRAMRSAARNALHRRPRQRCEPRPLRRDHGEHSPYLSRSALGAEALKASSG